MTDITLPQYLAAKKRLEQNLAILINEQITQFTTLTGVGVDAISVERQEVSYQPIGYLGRVPLHSPTVVKVFCNLEDL